MARTAAKVGKGTTLHYAPDSTGTPGTYVKVGELVSVGQPRITAGTAEATHYESQNSHIEKITTGWKDGDNVPFTINFVKGQVNTLRGLIGTEQWFKITYPDTSTDIWYGSITALGGDEIPNKDTIRSRGEMAIMGPVTFTAGA